ncbi:hypothetical protein [Neobacillus rhizophilus]|uniref:Uncharacterized protein n=1 Tax=Neobacillus rhizophilus TaxID=2833579 RepID=A0A942U4J8_9BACI|nr:hypothetical protein [Neobacillus rhizophilus]MBS4212737.1 hypothetical protein [Neobacillus rhizophilus]
MNKYFKSIGLVVGGIAVLYIVLKLILFILELIFRGVIAVFTSGVIYLVILSIIIYIFRNPIIRFFKSINGEQRYIRKPKPYVVYVPPSKDDQSSNFKNNITQSKSIGEEKLAQRTDKKVSGEDFKRDRENSGAQLDFINYVKLLSFQETTYILDTNYKDLSNKYQNEAGFGENGAIEFVASLLLMKYDPSTRYDIKKGIEMVFTNSWGAIDFSDHLDMVVHKSKVPYSMWSEVYRYLKNLTYIQSHPCAKNATKISVKYMEVSEQILTIRYTSNGLLDYTDISQKINIICLHMTNQGDYDLAKKGLEPLFFQMIEFFRECYKNRLFSNNQYWFSYFEVLSDLLMNLAVCEVNLGHDGACVNHASLSVKISNNPNGKMDKAGELILYALTHKGNAMLIHPKDLLKEQIPHLFSEKAKLLYDTLILN